ncbi:MAG: radical SAM protein [Deltaproteobacteria bacterium]|nr:radical SAM protein [Deltaproteobacteria bacterium]
MTGPQFRYRPLLTLLELTRRCNLRCLHCGSTSGRAVAGELSTTEWETVVDDVAALDARELVLLGGEPLLHRDWERLARHARACGLAPLLITNGMLLDADVARRCAAAGVDRVGVSIDAADPEVHDRIRGVAGSHARAWAAVGHLRGAGLTCSVITTVSRLNRDQLPGLRDRLLGRGLGWQIQTATPNGARFPREQVLSPAEFYEVVRFVSECRARHSLDQLPVAGAHDFGYHSTTLQNYAERPEWHGCEGGLATVGVRADGTVMPCLSMADRFAEGNVRDPGGIRTIWTDPNRFARNRRFRPEQLEGGCRGCAHGATCRAGCPDVAWNATGSAFDNPYCLYRIERQRGGPGPGA